MTTSRFKSESDIQNEIRLAVSKHGSRMFRNNVGLFRTQDGRTVRTGLCVGSSDLIGWTPHVITADDVGRTVAVFTAIEVKKPGGRATADQENFIQVVSDSGGISGIVTDSDSAECLVKKK